MAKKNRKPKLKVNRNVSEHAEASIKGATSSSRATSTFVEDRNSKLSSSPTSIRSARLEDSQELQAGATRDGSKSCSTSTNASRSSSLRQRSIPSKPASIDESNTDVYSDTNSIAGNLVSIASNIFSSTVPTPSPFSTRKCNGRMNLYAFRLNILLATILFQVWTQPLEELSNQATIINRFATPVLVLTIQMAISFEGLPAWATWIQFSCAVISFTVSCLILAARKNLIDKFKDASYSQEFVGLIILYGSLACINYFGLEMEPSFVYWFNTSPSDPNFVPETTLYLAASMTFGLAIIIQLPALFLEAMRVGFYKIPTAPNRKDGEKGLASVLHAILFHLSFASLLVAIWFLMVAEDIQMFIVFTYTFLAPAVLLGVAIYRHGFISRLLANENAGVASEETSSAELATLPGP